MPDKRVQVQLPQEQEENQGRSSVKSRRYLIIALLILVPLLIFLMGLALFLVTPTSSEPYRYEIRRFSGTAAIYTRRTREWLKVTRRSHGENLAYPRDKIKTEKDADLDLAIPDVFDLRLKESSEIEMLPRKSESVWRMKLLRGAILGFPHKHLEDETLEIETSLFRALIPRASFLIQKAENNGCSIGILEGTAEIYPHGSKEAVHLKMLEMLTVTQNRALPLTPKRVNYQEWRKLSEVRDLSTVTAEQIAEQIDLRKKAGTLFKYVFDEGVFFKPNWGFANREFYEEGEPKGVVLRLDYDVYPKDSFSGMYFKVRDLDLSKAKHLTFSLRGSSEKELLQQFRIELKDQFSIVRGFAVKPITRDWRFYGFDFSAPKATPVSELVFVFENSRVGALATNGTVYLKDINIE
ncbi:MAG: FecR domain-containing protein [Candidatus Omnitrophica bacterium]|nr:FecR domain-containing protein [Candidatus Omnitrophota bacterium]